ncbi:MAG: MobQ family relaxase [Cyanobacteria bacterium J06635_11]
MAIFSMRMQVIGRSAGRSATAAAAYRSGEEVKDERTGKVHDYTGKSDIYGSEILLPEGAPERLSDRVVLWNEVERSEKRKDAQLSREVMVALPAELTHEQKQTLTREYVQSEFVEQGMIADIGYHDFDSHNPHAHIMLTMRGVDEDGFGKKRRDWNKRQALDRQRKAWEEYANRALARAGFDEQIDHRSLKEQGVERKPQIHLGAKVLEMEARGVPTRVGEESRRISKVNRDIERKAAQREKVQAEIEAEQVQTETYILPEFFYSGELEIDAKQAVSSQSDRVLFPELEDWRSHQPSVPTVDPEVVRQFGELLVRRGEEIALENSPEAAKLAAEIEKVTAKMSELSATADGVFETMARLLGKSGEFQRLADEKQRQAQQNKGRSQAPPDEKKQERVQRQERLKQRQRKRAKKRDQEMEL